MGAKFGGSLFTLHSGGLSSDYLEKQEQKSRYARQLEQQIRDKKERLRQEKEGAYSSVRKGAVTTSFQSELSSAHQRRLQADGGAVLANGRADDSPPFSYQAQQAFPSSIGSPNAYNERSMPGRPQLNSSAFSPNADNGKRWSPAASTGNLNLPPNATWQSQNEPWSSVGSSQALSPQREDQTWGREQLPSVSPPKTRPFMTGVANLHGLNSADRGREDQKRQNPSVFSTLQEYAMELERQIQDKARRKVLEREERIARERKEEAEAAAYNPWGRGGGGAPLRDPTGAVITELRGLRKAPDQERLGTGSNPGSPAGGGFQAAEQQTSFRSGLQPVEQQGFQPVEQQTNFRRRNHFTSGAEARVGTSPLRRPVETSSREMSPGFAGRSAREDLPREDFPQRSEPESTWQEPAFEANAKGSNWGSPTSQIGVDSGAQKGGGDSGNHSYGKMRQEMMSDWERAQFLQKQAAKERVQAELRAQIEEKKRRKEEEEARARREEEAQERKIAQDQERLRAAFEAEQAKARAKASQAEAAAAALPPGKVAKGRPRGGQVVELSGDVFKSNGKNKAFEEPSSRPTPSPRRRAGREQETANTAADSFLDAKKGRAEASAEAGRNEEENKEADRGKDNGSHGLVRTGLLTDPVVSSSPIEQRKRGDHLGRILEDDSPKCHMGSPSRNVADGHWPDQASGMSEMEKFQMQMRQEQMEMKLRMERQERELGDLRSAALSSQAEARAAQSELERMRLAMRLGNSPLMRSNDAGKLSLDSPVGRLELALLPINSSFDFSGGVDVASSMHSESMMIYPPNAKLGGGSRPPTGYMSRAALAMGGDMDATYDPIALGGARPLSSLPGGRAAQIRPPTSARIQ